MELPYGRGSDPSRDREGAVTCRMTLREAISAARRYGLAIGFVAVAAGVRAALGPILGGGESLLVFVPAILAAVRVGGSGPAVAATGFSLLAAAFFPDILSHTAGLMLLAASGIGISLLGRALSAPASPDARTGSGATRSFLWRSALLSGAMTSLLILTGLLYKDLGRQQEAQYWVEHTYQVLNETRGLMSALGQAEAAQRGYLITGDSAYLDTLQEELGAVEAIARELRQLTADNPSHETRLNALDQLIEARSARFREAIQIRGRSGLDAALEAVRTSNGRQLMEELRAALDAIEVDERNLLAERTGTVRRQSAAMRWLLALGSGSLLLLLVVTGAVIERDIRERDRARRALRQSEERLRLALDSAKAGTWEWDLLTNENVWSDELWKLYGLEPHSCPPSFEAWRKVVHPDDLARAEAVVAEAAQSGGELSVEFRVAGGPAERWILARARALRDAKGRARRFIGIALDITERKRAEEALREREQNLRRFTEAAPVAIAMFDREMRYLAASERYREDYRLGQRELTGHSHYEIFPEISQAWRDIHQRCLAGAAEQSDGEAFTRADGEEQWIRWAIQPWRQADGAIGGIVLFSEDMTWQKRSEQALRESEARFRTLANAIPQLCWMADADGWIFWYNQRWYDYTGATPEGMAGWGWQSVHDPQVLPQVMERWKKSLETAEPFEMVFPLRGADGVFRPFLTRIVPVYDDAGKVVRWFGTNTDITEQQNAGEALRRASEQRRLALEAAELGAWHFRYETGEVLWDEHCQSMYGFARDDPANYENIIGRIHPEDRPATEEAVRQAVAGVNGGAYHSEHRVIWPDGSVHWVASHGRMHFDSENGGKPTHFIGVNMDVTARKEAELEIRSLNAQLEQRVAERTAELETINRELEAFAYSVSHDLRAPLRGIDGWSLALLEDYEGRLDSQAQQYLRRVRSEAQRMGELIDSMLLLSRITRAEMQPSEVDLSALAEAVSARLREEHAGREIEFRIEGGLSASGDPRLLEIALTNLLGNAVKFTGPQPAARIQFGRTGAGNAFYVRDNGVGFDMTFAKGLFGAFQRLHKASEFPGAGIGLATVQRIIHRHGGRVWAESQPGLGATFYFTLGAQ